MLFESGKLYHVYNRGNNRERIFYSDDNYVFFLKKIRKELVPLCDILAYCLMPNHYHMLICPKDLDISKLPRKIGTLQSSYSQAINIQENRTGSLFQQRAKSKPLENHAFICFHYIHQNPWKAGLCKSLEDWEFSSLRDYLGLRSGTLPKQELAIQLLDLPSDPREFYLEAKTVINDKLIDHIV